MLSDKMKVTSDTGVGQPAHFHYDPYYHRYIEHQKRLLTQGNPIIVRLHPGTAYPMKDDTLHYRVDREGHVVALVGYDDDTQEFIVADPWQKESWGGERGGLGRIPYITMVSIQVDGTLDAMSLPVPWEFEVTVKDSLDGSDTLEVVVGVEYSCPTPLPRSYYHLHDCHAKLTLPSGLTLEDQSVKSVGENGIFAPGETATVSWKIVQSGVVDGDISVQVRGTVTSDDPFSYTDVIGQSATTHVQLIPTKVASY